MLTISFILSIMAGVIANYISKWLDERDDSDEPRVSPCLPYGNKKAPKLTPWGLFEYRYDDYYLCRKQYNTIPR